MRAIGCVSKGTNVVHELKMIAPATVSREALQDQRSAIAVRLHGFAIAIVVYCQRNQAGAMWLSIDDKPDVGVWSSVSPVSIDEYLQSLAAQGVAFQPGPDLERWVAHVTGQTTRSN